MRNAWSSRIGMVMLVGVMVLSAGLVLANYGGGVTLAAAKDLTGVTPNWDQNLPSASRFNVLAAFGGHAVRDNNTGLVWEQSPDPAPALGWVGATTSCITKTVGGTVGWRLPSVVELRSVQDPSLPAPFVPSIFNNIQPAFYFSASSYSADTTTAWVVNFNVITDVARGAKVQSFNAWCVRGPMNADTY
jgi:hypothetical protein